MAAKHPTGSLQEAVDAVQEHGSITEAAKVLDLPRSTLTSRYNTAISKGLKASTEDDARIAITEGDHGTVVEYVGPDAIPIDKLLADHGITLDKWRIVSATVNTWPVGGKRHQGQELLTDDEGKQSVAWKEQRLWKMRLRQVRLRLVPRESEEVAMQAILQDIASGAPVVPKIKRPKQAKAAKVRRSLEVSLMDPHLGLQCYQGSSDHAWTIEQCESVAVWAIEGLTKQAALYGPYEEVVFTFGNDFLHIDRDDSATTKGTLQPEALEWSEIYRRGAGLGVKMVDMLKEVAPVKVYQIPGNHDQNSSYTLGLFLWAYYRNDQNVEVDAGPEPYKFHRFGQTLLGFDHGHHVKPMRLAALMANERRQDWAETSYREWHLGDQHRKGSSTLVTLEEQGVSVEYLPGLTPANSWHKRKAFNWQKRGAMAWVYDYSAGPLARVQVNMDSYTGGPMGG